MNNISTRQTRQVARGMIDAVPDQIREATAAVAAVPKQAGLLRSVPAKPRPETVHITVDQREKLPYSMDPMIGVSGCLTSGDYALRAMPKVAVVERKSLDDLLSCIGRERDRLEREIRRLLAFGSRALVVESSWADIRRGNWRSKVKPEQVMGSLIGWHADGLGFFLACDRDEAAEYTRRFLYMAFRRRWTENRQAMIQATEAVNDASL